MLGFINYWIFQWFTLRLVRTTHYNDISGKLIGITYSIWYGVKPMTGWDTEYIFYSWSNTKSTKEEIIPKLPTKEEMVLVKITEATANDEIEWSYIANQKDIYATYKNIKLEIIAPITSYYSSYLRINDATVNCNTSAFFKAFSENRNRFYKKLEIERQKEWELKIAEAFDILELK